MQIKLTDRARELGAPQALEALARAEIQRAFGPKFRLPSAPVPTVEIKVYIPQAHLVAVPVGPALWVVDTLNMHRISAFTEPLRFTPRAAALIVNLGWCFKEVEAEARRVLAEGDMDARIVSFALPLELVRLMVVNNGTDREVDLDELAVA